MKNIVQPEKWQVGDELEAVADIEGTLGYGDPDVPLGTRFAIAKLTQQDRGGMANVYGPDGNQRYAQRFKNLSLIEREAKVQATFKPVWPAYGSALPTEAQERKDVPLARGVLDYFPAALAEVARVSKAGNDQHNPGQEMHHARGKSTDHADCIARHLLDRGRRDTDGMRHSAKLAWRALALLQEELEAEGAPLARGAKLPEEPAGKPEDLADLTTVAKGEEPLKAGDLVTCFGCPAVAHAYIPGACVDAKKVQG